MGLKPFKLLTYSNLDFYNINLSMSMINFKVKLPKVITNVITKPQL